MEIKHPVLNKFFLFNILLSFIAIQSYSQAIQKELKFDSLVKVNDRYEVEDIGKLNLLINLSKGYTDVNPDKGVETAELAIVLAHKFGKELEFAAAMHYKADNLIAKGDIQLAIFC